MRSALALALLVVTLAAPATRSTSAQPTPTPIPLATVACELPDLPVEASCYRLTVPENRGDSATRDIDLFIAVLKSPRPDPAATPSSS
ncbi:MAG: hypothetical protein M3545_18470, partial [Acidobacteriota bacterium]|nr:hypothetical protein [Acidobacteriota bacterium]